MQYFYRKKMRFVENVKKVKKKTEEVNNIYALDLDFEENIEVSF